MAGPLLLLASAAVVLWWSRTAVPSAAGLDRRAVQAPGRPGPVERVGRGAYPLVPASLREGLSRRAALAGERSAYRVVGAKVCSLAAGGGLVALVLARGVTPMAVLFACLMSFSAWNLPDLRLVSRGRERQDALRRTLADTTDQVALCMQAGLGFDAALARVATAGSGPLAEELTRVLHDVSLGMARPEAFARMLERTDVPELRQLVAAVNQAERYGVSVADTLRAQSADLRERRRQWAEEQATKVPVKLLFPLVFCIMPSLFIILLGPAALRVVGSGIGG